MKKRKNDFCNVINESIKILECVRKYLKMLKENYKTIYGIENKLTELSLLCQGNSQNIISYINNTFITPIDKEDIYAMAISLECIINSTNNLAVSLRASKIKLLNNEAKLMINLLCKVSEVIINLLMNLNKKNSIKLMENEKKSIDLLRLEFQKHYTSLLKQVFSGKLNILESMKWKCVIDSFEKSFAEYEKASKLLEGIVIKNY